MDERAKFHHVWLDSRSANWFSAPTSGTTKTNELYKCSDNRLKAINSLGMHTPLQYFCVFNANTGKVIAASFE